MQEINNNENIDSEYGVILLPDSVSDSDSEIELKPSTFNCEPPDLRPNISSFNNLDEKCLVASLKTKFEIEIFFVIFY